MGKSCSIGRKAAYCGVCDRRNTEIEGDFPAFCERATGMKLCSVLTYNRARLNHEDGND
jgi:hypothetical protein